MAKPFAKIKATPKTMLFDAEGGADITFHVDRPLVPLMRQYWQEIKERTAEKPHLSLSFAKYHNARSLDQNAMLWALLEEQKEALQASGVRNPDGTPISEWDLYLKALASYGSRGEFIECLKEAVPSLKRMFREVVELQEREKVNDKGTQVTTVLCKAFPGSSSYDSAEMNKLIDGVLEECRQLGIESVVIDYAHPE